MACIWTPVSPKRGVLGGAAFGTWSALQLGMTNALTPCSRLLVLLLVATAALSGCGSSRGFSREELRSLSESKLGSSIDSEMVSAEFHSTRCERAEADACPKSPTPEVEVHVEERSVVFDFSNVQSPGVFADAQFEGFVADLTHPERSVLYAMVNATFTNVDLGPDAVVYDRGGVELNLAGVAYDSTTFIRVDLLVAPLNLLRNVE